MSGPRYLRALPDPRDVIVIDWLQEHDAVDAGPVLDAVFETLADIRQVRRWPWDPVTEALRPVDRDARARRWAVLVAAALITALVVGALVPGGFLDRLRATPTPAPVPTAPAVVVPSVPVAPSAPAAVFPLASPRLVIVSAGQDGNLYLDWSDGAPRERIGLDVAQGMAQPGWARDGSRIVVLSGGGQDVEQQWEVDPTGTVGSQVVLPCIAPCGSRNEASYSPDGTKIVFFQARGEPVLGIPPECGIFLYDRASQDIEPIQEFACGTEEDREPRISPDGTKVAFWRSRHHLQGSSLAVDDGAIFIRDLTTGEELQVTEWPVHATSLDWSPDGQWLTFTKEWWRYADPAYRTDVWRIHPDGTGLQQLTDLGNAIAWQPRYSPDGQWVLFSRVGDDRSRLWAVPATGGQDVEVLPGGGDIYQFDVLPAEILDLVRQASATPSPSST